MDMNKHLENPFLTRGFLKDEWFCDRETETEKLLSNALNGVDTTLISPRKYGKTGLIFHLFHRIEAENLPIKCIYVDLFHTRSLEDFVKTLADELIKFPPQTTFGQRVLDFIKRLRPVLSYDSLTGDPQVSFTYQLEAEKEQNLKNILDFLNSQPEQIILAMDEFQQVTEYPENMEGSSTRSYSELAQHPLYFLRKQPSTDGRNVHVTEETFILSNTTTTSGQNQRRQIRSLHQKTIQRRRNANRRRGDSFYIRVDTPTHLLYTKPMQ